MDRNRILTSLLTLFVVISIGSFGSAIYLYQEKEALQEQLNDLDNGVASKNAAEKATKVVVEASSRPDDSSDVKALNAYIDKLEKEKNALLAQVSQGNQRGNNGRRRGQRMNLEELKESNPEEYKRIMTFREEMQKRANEHSNKRKTFFSSLDTSRMNAEQKSTLEDYQSLLNDMDEARNNPNGDRREMFQMMREANEMRSSVQGILFEQLGNKLGTDGTSLAAGVTEILEITGPGMGGPGGGMGGPGGPGGMGGGPRGGGNN